MEIGTHVLNIITYKKLSSEQSKWCVWWGGGGGGAFYVVYEDTNLYNDMGMT